VQKARLKPRGVLERFVAKTPTSQRLHSDAIGISPGGVNAGIKHFEPYPIFMKRASGSRIWDVDGNEYVDYLMSYGAIVLGHGHQKIKEALSNVLDSVGTTVTGTPTELELTYGAMLRDIYHKDGLIRFTNSGLEATLLAVRLARGYTGRRKVAKFEGHYHGAVDSLLFSYSPGEQAAGQSSVVPIADSLEVDKSALADSVVLQFNDWEATEASLTRHARELACVIMEPFEDGVIPGDKKFMTNLRRLTTDLEIPLIYDEVKTGFRVRVGGASEFYSIAPDLTCLGKIIGGGLPIGAVVGDPKMMGLLDPRREMGKRVFHSGTFNGNPFSLNAGKSTVDELRRKGRFDELKIRTDSLRRLFSRTLEDYQIPSVFLGEGGMFNFFLTDKPVRNYRDALRSNLALRNLLDIELITEGIYLKPGNRFCLSLSHSQSDIRLTGEIFERVVRSMVA
jgi:glutamate-1-semialdehyde 2,1-aminomutase